MTNTLSIINDAATTIAGNLIPGTNTAVALSGETLAVTVMATFAEQTTLTFSSLTNGTALASDTVLLAGT